VNNTILRILVAVFVLADGALHLALDFVLFRGNLFGNPFAGGPPSGSPPPGSPPRTGGAPPLPLPLNQLFLLNFVGAVILAVLYWFAHRRLGSKSWIINIILIFYEAAAFAGWLLFGSPNPMGLGYLSKAIEIFIIGALAIDIWRKVHLRKDISAT
jgi:hypothetical protein